MTKLITVVRDKNFYNTLVKNNPFNKGANFVFLDNTKINKGIPEHYNKYLDNYDFSDEDWLVFCHEDWETKEEWLSKLDNLDKNSIYGTFGTKIKKHKKFAEKIYIGNIESSHKDGRDVNIIGQKVLTGTEVETFDCMVIIIHSSLIKKYNIRFDENLKFHHYTEELNIRLNEEFGIKSRILQIHCRHWSYGCSLPDKNFDAAYSYVKNKFKDTKNIYSNTVVDTVIGPLNLPVHRKYALEDRNFSFYLTNLISFPIFRFFISGNQLAWYIYILKLPIIKKDYQKFRLFLFGIPLLKIRWDNVFGIYLFHAIPIIKFKKGK